MCSECGFYNCSCMCPNAPEEEAVKKCDECKSGIYSNDGYYDIGGEVICENCIIKNHYKIAE